MQTRQKNISVTCPHRHLVARHGNVRLVKVLNVLERDNVGLVNTDEHVLGQDFLQVLQGKQSRDATLGGMECDIFVLPFNIKQVVVVDLVKLVVGLGWNG